MPAALPRENQREHILDVALSLMSEEGSAAMSMRSLAKACGLQVAAIYHYFPSKDALLHSVVEERRYGSRMQEDSLRIDASADLEGRLRSVFEIFWRGALEEEPVLRLLLGEGLRNQPAAFPTGIALLEVFNDGVVALLESHVPELDDQVLGAQLMVSEIFSGFIRHIFEPDLDTDEIARLHGDVFVAASLALI